ncbi:NnrU family protein [Methyloversatilis universalis]|uniref:NnrU family protein n=1 Tax=Methyloversatilis universalis TaxID=378211 RepID=UPI000381B45D|nr:NnrU family protein [Methyloversatilis universalis]
MAALIAGLLLVIGVHALRLVAPDLRGQVIARHGAWLWRAAHSLASLAGFALLVWGYGQTRADPLWLWLPPPWSRHATAALMLPAFVLLAASLLPGSRIAARLRQPLAAAVALWGGAHLLANGTLADLLLFGSFLVWALVDFVLLRRRESDDARAAPGVVRDLQVLLVGVAGWAAFAFWLHGPLIGVRPF